MIVLGIESSCDETGVALYDTDKGLLSHALHSQIALHAEYGGVVPELASRDHIRRAVPLLKKAFADAGITPDDVTAVGYTQGPGLAGALLTGASVAAGIAFSLGKPIIGVHHLEGHLLSPLLTDNPPKFPFVALLVSGGHTQLMEVKGIGQYRLLGETLDDAAGEAFDKSAKLLGLPYPGGAEISRLASECGSCAIELPRPMIHSGDLNFSFSGLKTAVLNVRKKQENFTEESRRELARAFVDSAVDVLTAKCKTALKQTGHTRLVVAGGVGANRQLRASLIKMAKRRKAYAYFPETQFCTDNGAMIAFAAAMRLKDNPARAVYDYSFTVKPRWPLEEIE